MRKMLRLALTFFMLIVAANLSLCTANPLPHPSVPTSPDKNEPTIIIREPANCITHNDSKIHYSVTVVKPTSWFSNNSIHGSIRCVRFYLDSVREVRNSDEQDNDNQLPLNYEGAITNLSEGNHSLQIYVQSTTIFNSLYDEANWFTWDAMEFYHMDTYSQKINFTIATSTEPIQTQTPTSTPTPTSISPSATPNLIIERFPNYPLLMQTAIILAIAILTIIILSLLLYRRHRKTALNSKIG